MAKQLMTKADADALKGVIVDLCELGGVFLEPVPFIDVLTRAVNTFDALPQVTPALPALDEKALDAARVAVHGEGNDVARLLASQLLRKHVAAYLAALPPSPSASDKRCDEKHPFGFCDCSPSASEGAESRAPYRLGFYEFQQLREWVARTADVMDTLTGDGGIAVHLDRDTLMATMEAFSGICHAHRFLTGKTPDSAPVPPAPSAVSEDDVQIVEYAMQYTYGDNQQSTVNCKRILSALRTTPPAVVPEVTEVDLAKIRASYAMIDADTSDDPPFLVDHRGFFKRVLAAVEYVHSLRTAPTANGEVGK